MDVLLPEGWAPPIGYSNGIAVTAGRMVFIAGQVGWDAQQKFNSTEIAPQFEQACWRFLPKRAEKRAISAA
jgi:enamine deaminase RidA (YjgF/YER057c/UK114 family)